MKIKWTNFEEDTPTYDDYIIVKYANRYFQSGRFQSISPKSKKVNDRITGVKNGMPVYAPESSKFVWFIDTDKCVCLDKNAKWFKVE